MSHPYPIPPAWPLFAFFSNVPDLLEKASRLLEDKYGPWQVPPLDYPFTHSDYYTEEMGPGLVKRLCIGSRTVPREDLADLKAEGAALEQDFSRNGDLESRQVNIDPGYIALEHMVLFSWKPRAHKILVGGGVYGDLQLLWRRDAKSFEAMPWSFPDYASDPVRKYLSDVRDSLHRKSAPKEV